jgi:hypothetical protein
MAGATLNFSAQVADWVKANQTAMTSIFRKSCERVNEEMEKTRAEGGNMPVDTGFLRASIQASKEAMPKIREDAKPVAGTKYTYDSGPINLVINTLELGETLYTGFTAAYSAHVNYGTSKTPARLFVELAAQQWPEIVKRTEAELSRDLGR